MRVKIEAAIAWIGDARLRSFDAELVALAVGECTDPLATSLALVAAVVLVEVAKLVVVELETVLCVAAALVAAAAMLIPL